MSQNIGSGYDVATISAHARALHRLAGIIEAIHILAGVGAVAVGSALLTRYLAFSAPVSGTLALSGGLVGGLLGWGIGRQRALLMQCQAHVAMAQLQIELNTRLAVFHMTVRPQRLPPAP